MNLALAALEPRQHAVVTALDLEFAVRERLAALGLRIGRKLHIVRRVGSSGQAVRQLTQELVVGAPKVRPKGMGGT